MAVVLSRNPATPLATNPHLLRWVEKMRELMRPAAIHWVDGSEEEYEQLCGQMVRDGALHEAERRTLARLLRRAVGPE